MRQSARRLRRAAAQSAKQSLSAWRRDGKGIAVALVKTVIDGREIEVERDRWALDVARDLGITIPTLCNHPALEPYGACRLCVVEVTRGKWTWLTTSCDLPIREGLSIRTDTPATLKARRTALELLWAEAPDAVEIQRMARAMGMQKPRFAPRVREGRCILCGLCVRVCRDLIGASAIGFAQRGTDRRIGSPFNIAAKGCIGCMACVSVCPTDAIRVVDDGCVRHMETFNTDLELATCEVCGRPSVPLRLLEFIRTKLPEEIPVSSLCQRCRRSRTAASLSDVTAVASQLGYVLEGGAAKAK